MLRSTTSNLRLKTTPKLLFKNPRVPNHVKLELLLNKSSFTALNEDKHGYFREMRERCPFYASPINEDDTIVAVVGPTTYNTSHSTFSAVSAMRRVILEDQELQQHVDISEQDLAYRLRIVVQFVWKGLLIFGRKAFLNQNIGVLSLKKLFQQKTYQFTRFF